MRLSNLSQSKNQTVLLLKTKISDPGAELLKSSVVAVIPVGHNLEYEISVDERHCKKQI
jgi:hypothetical protein